MKKPDRRYVFTATVLKWTRPVLQKHLYVHNNVNNNNNNVTSNFSATEAAFVKRQLDGEFFTALCPNSGFRP